MPELAVDEQIEIESSGSDSPEPSLEIADLLVEDVSIDGMCGVY